MKGFFLVCAVLLFEYGNSQVVCIMDQPQRNCSTMVNILGTFSPCHSDTISRRALKENIILLLNDTSYKMESFDLDFVTLNNDHVRTRTFHGNTAYIDCGDIFFEELESAVTVYIDNIRVVVEGRRAKLPSIVKYVR
jgi:hypothetical protein